MFGLFGMSNTPEEDNGDYLSLRQLHEALTKDYGLKISLSTLSEYAKKGIIKPDYSTSDKLLYLKVRVPGIADLLKTIKTNPQLLAEQQLPQQPIVVPLKQDQEQPEQIPDITRVSLSEEILIRLQVLEKQVKDQQEENHKLKMQIADLEETVKKHYEEYHEDYKALYDAIKKFGEIGDKINQHNRENFERIEHEINQIRAVINKWLGIRNLP